MKNKLWMRPNGTVAMTSVDCDENEELLLQLDNVPSDWELITNDYEGEFPSVGSSDSWIWDGSKIAVDPTYIPSITVNAYQIRAALNQSGLRSAVESIISAGSQDLQDAWNHWPTFSRNYPLIISLGQALGKTDAEMTALFQLAETLAP